ncbi:U3 small nucleolar ribonucleoprotein MPP10 [Danaus plexippus plexippus]|uniref:U3 small nucleolar ribonucleoprotein protein MPP10 n=1 Tax=Danaus plexippus plexippus TaxID=278856 RepID=A0A212EKA4_DANPL|nr:U3 small nucleolar ribonucleoprotein MPP10 [Danaus plexippus plexippus]
MTSEKIDDIIDKFSVLTEKPVKFLTVQDDIQGDIRNLVKSIYDLTKSQESSNKKKKALSSMIVSDCDEEQIWQQIELQNSERWDELVWDVANSVSSKNDLTFPLEFPEEKDEEDIKNEDDVMSEEEHQEVEQSNVKVAKTKPSKKQSIVDDDFFKLQDMENFLLKEEKMEGKNKKSEDDEDSIDMFEDIDSEGSDEEGGKDVKYYDFFNEDNESGQEDNDEEDDDEHEENNDYKTEPKEHKKSDKKVRFLEPDSESGDSEDSEEQKSKHINGSDKENKSEFELRQERLQKHISRLEEKSINEAPWQLKGEVDAMKRPQNSLLEEVLDFDLTTRPPPVITEQTTVTLEGLIRQRIKDKAWDDVTRKEKPVDDQFLFKKPEVLDQSKSKMSLAQVYEAEYLKQKQASSGEVDDEKEPESHTEIREAMKNLFSKLDALCHYHYTPKPPQAEVKIVSNTPAISMEEVAPVAVSDATLLAPEEVKRKTKGDLMSKEERTQTDKNRERRKKKKLQRKKGSVTKVTDNRNTKAAVESNDKSLKTSKAFFQQLNDNSTSLIKSKTKKLIKNKGQ